MLAGVASSISYVPHAPSATASRDGACHRPPAMQLQGGSLRTYPTFGNNVEVGVGSDGRPVDANIELWQGPNNTPFKMRVRGEDGLRRPVSAMMPQGRWGREGTVVTRNNGPMEFPIHADIFEGPNANAFNPMAAAMSGPPTTIQGGALRTYTFDSSVASIQAQRTAPTSAPT